MFTDAFQEPQPGSEEARSRSDAFQEQHVSELQKPQVDLKRKDGHVVLFSCLIPSSLLSSVGHTAEAIPEAARMTTTEDPGQHTLTLKPVLS